ncbi:Thioesterase/thiol ester dehydrase-isomerase, partial [Auriscalpium vulgare]
RVSITEVSLNPMAEEPSKFEARVVCELFVEEDMLNISGNMHGGCAAYLVDICSTLPIAAYNADGRSGVSQIINMIYHAPAKLGAKLKIISTTIAVGGRTMSARCEIWDATNQRLVASGIQVKMDASPAKL